MLFNVSITLWSSLVEIFFTFKINILNDYGFPAGLQFENNCEVGVFSKLTNAYCLVAIGGSESFYRFSFILD